MEQAIDFLEESRQLYRLMIKRENSDYYKKTQFKDWTIDQVFGHLHIFNHAANISLKSSDAFDSFFTPMAVAISNGSKLVDIQVEWLDGLSGPNLLHAWWEGVLEISEKYTRANPKVRLKWVGPEMSAKSSVTARQMETWAHGQEIFDILGETRVEHDRIRNIVHLGVSTFGWTFDNRQMSIPNHPPYVKLQSPSGSNWEWNEPSLISRVEGLAVDFASVVAQTRNVKDTSLKVTGDVAKKWMSIAQCFAGPPSDPPPVNTRFVVARK
ncbi:MAG: TIGR03084 family metal-binding protein [Pseudomonadota bacterium]|nr:TIGR03084 family metal-binding protein [Pseudomonadota bacterium]